MIDQKKAMSFFHYDPCGRLLWVSPLSNRAKPGCVAGSLHKPSGYRYIKVDGKQYKEHRLIWLYFNGSFPDGDIDHINGNRSDNRIENLRAVPHAMNQQNQRLPSKNNRSGFLGVSLIKATGKYRAAISSNYESICIGIFDNAEDAHLAYLAKKRGMHAGCTL